MYKEITMGWFFPDKENSTKKTESTQYHSTTAKKRKDEKQNTEMPENELRVSCLLNEGYSVYSNVRVMRYSVSENEDAFDQYSYLHSTPRQTSPSPLPRSSIPSESAFS